MSWNKQQLHNKIKYGFLNL